MARKKIEFDPKILDLMGMVHATDEEMAAYFSCTVKTIENRRKSDPAFQKTLDAGRGKGRVSLRRKQFEAALAGDRVMMIWLGKQLLGQKDSVEVDQKTEHSGGVVINFPKEFIGL